MRPKIIIYPCRIFVFRASKRNNLKYNITYDSYTWLYCCRLLSYKFDKYNKKESTLLRMGTVTSENLESVYDIVICHLVNGHGGLIYATLVCKASNTPTWFVVRKDLWCEFVSCLSYTVKVRWPSSQRPAMGKIYI